MKSHVTPEFRRLFAALPADVKERARRSYLRRKENPAHPGVQFKRVHSSQSIYSVRIGIGWRALGVRQDDKMVWFWVGSHAQYDGLLARL